MFPFLHRHQYSIFKEQTKLVEVTGNDPAYIACKAIANPSQLHPQTLRLTLNIVKYNKKARKLFSLRASLIFLRVLWLHRKSP